MTKPRETVYQVSTNRSRASHRVRYVESSAPPEGECRLCVGTLTEKQKPDSDQNQVESEDDPQGHS